MKNLPALYCTCLLFLTAALSCKKEYSYEKSAGTLLDESGLCKPVEAVGRYRKNVPVVSDSFYVTVEVNVTKTGSYSISTNSNNGFLFGASGNFTNPGVQKIYLKAQGTPLKDTLTQFICYFDKSICSFSVTVKTDSIIIVDDKAAGSLGSNMGICQPVEISGTYRQGASLAPDSFFVNVEVNVSKTGKYNISTNTINGFRFTGSGNFTGTGVQKVKLKAAGSPITDSPSEFTTSFGSSNCSFIVNISKDNILTEPPALPPIELNTWRFTDLTDGTFHKGVVDPANTWLTTTPGTDDHYLNIMGWPPNGKDTLFLIELHFALFQVDTGTYAITAGVKGNNVFAYANNTILPEAPTQSYFFFYRSTFDKNPAFIFRITEYDAVEKKVKGEFYGTSQRRREYSDYVGGEHDIYGEFYFQL